MRQDDFECIEPSLQAKIDEVVMAGGDPWAHADLARHLKICHACRENQRFAESVQALIAKGVGVSFADRLRRVLGLKPGRKPGGASARGGRTPLWALAGTAAAGALILTLILPPTQRAYLGLADNSLRARGGSPKVAIQRPVEGEVLYLSGGELTWQPVEKARAYRVTVESKDGSFHWTGVVETNVLPLPKESESPGAYTAYVEPLPSDLVPEREGSVFFSRDRLFAFLSYRLTHLPVISALLVLGACGLVVATAVRRS
jgi:hypothetical protein